ncbi:MAG: FecR domain-containing protein [Treponema sp.]|nr:FecR domain-containing protein [Treponema sp.]
MKKKTKFKSKNDLLIPFLIAILICLIGAAISYWFFHMSFFRALSKMDEEPIATITFKYKTAERKFMDRVIWDRLRQNSPVYNGDTIHTADISEATIWFEDGTTLDLAENTMAQVFLHDDGTLGADLEFGDANVDSAEDGNGFSFTSGGNKVSVRKGSKFSAKRLKGKGADFSLIEGGASFEDGEELSEGKTVSVEDGVKSNPAFSMTSPSSNQKFLYYDETPYTVNFSWVSNVPSQSLQLQIAGDKGFRNIVESIDVTDKNSVAVTLSKGIYYWRIVEGENSLSSGKFQIVQSLKPNLLVPAENYSYTYRKQTPSVRFIWAESDAATAYNFEVSRNPNMSNPVISQRSSSSSIIISTLEAGTYYYQVTPYYVLNRVGLANPSDVGSFKIVQRDRLNPPTLVSPANNSFMDKTKGSATLSWRMDDERMRYRVTVSKFQSLASPIIARDTNENYINISASELADMSDGEYFWAVTQTDSEGNESPKSVVRSFYAMSGEIEQRTVFPPDNYIMWQPLLSDARFTWKSNLKMAQYIQLARDRNFNDIVYESEIYGSSFSGVNLGAGEYYWRISTKSASFNHATPGKRLTVVGEIVAPTIVFPNQANKAVVRPKEPCRLTWNDTGNMDYYRIKIFKQGSEAPFFDETFITGHTLPIDTERMEEGAYRWEIQGYAYEGDLSSRRSSLLAEANFMLRKIQPVHLVSPARGTLFDGWEAIENPPVLTWSSNEDFSQAQLILTKKTGKDAGQTIYPQKGYKCQLPSLTFGDYEWTVRAKTMDDLDISAEEKYTFTVAEIPPFEAPKDAKTDGGSVFNVAYLRKTPYSVFKWQKVHRAGSYILEIYGDADKKYLTEILEGGDNTSFKFEDLTKLAKGNFIWRVRAVVMDESNSKILIDGNASERQFSIDYNLNSDGGKRKDTGELYAE